ncbi:uncharacterized protein LOC135097834 [Scylla paramamosain]|uniref:uncharacterized protein LOC135097834 n=1 Tax=Scylla paramamosain TaxID=85552 RepID=UPI003082F0DA
MFMITQRVRGTKGKQLEEIHSRDSALLICVWKYRGFACLHCCSSAEISWNLCHGACLSVLRFIGALRLCPSRPLFRSSGFSGNSPHTCCHTCLRDGDSTSSSPRFRRGGGGVRQDQTDLEWFVWIPIMRAYAPFDLLHVMLAQTVRRFWPQIRMHTRTHARTHARKVLVITCGKSIACSTTTSTTTITTTAVKTDIHQSAAGTTSPALVAKRRKRRKRRRRNTNEHKG